MLLFVITFINATASTEESVAELYIATFDRAPDANGLEYWLKSSLSIEEIARSFFDQDETKEKYPDELNNEEFITEVYANLFNRPADSEGFDYWLAELDSGRATRDVFILVVVNGAQGDDAKILDNKTEVGLAFAHDGRSDIDESRAVMEDITADPQSVDDTLCKFGLTGCSTTPPVDDPCTNPISHNGTEYGCITSPYTTRVWLDRNIGASKVCEVLDEVACYGDYYQWGRNFDGHQDSTSGTTDTLAIDVKNASTEFITPPSSPFDWTVVDNGGSARTSSWSKVDGSSVCPTGFRVPTLDELKAELLDAGSAEIRNKDDAFNSFLRLPSAGYRYDFSGSVNAAGSWGDVWTSSVDGSGSRDLYWDSGGTGWYNSGRADGLSVRCLRN